jgi:transcriptional regulator with XRE-family HTH domain
MLVCMAEDSPNKAGIERERRSRRTPPAIRRATRGLAEDLAAWRKLRGLTQAQLADRAGIGRATLARFEQGDGGIGLESLLRILRALGILENLTKALDPYESDVGRLRSDEELPRRVRPSNLIEEKDA